jgi:CRISPR-associated endonuclease Cas2
MTYLISYDLHAQKNYDRIITELKRFGAIKVLLSAWVVKHSNTTAAALRDHFANFLDSDDSLFVCRFDEWASRNCPNAKLLNS